MTISNRRDQRLAHAENPSKLYTRQIARSDFGGRLCVELIRPSCCVDLPSDCFKMRGIHTQRYSTEMIDLKTRRNRPAGSLVDHSMGRTVLAMHENSSVPSLLATTSRTPHRPGPNMTWGQVAHLLNYVLLKAFVFAKGATNMLRSEFCRLSAATSALHRRSQVIYRVKATPDIDVSSLLEVTR